MYYSSLLCKQINTLKSVLHIPNSIFKMYVRLKIHTPNHFQLHCSCCDTSSKPQLLSITIYANPIILSKQ